ncbi:type II secretion system protein GspL [Paraburkholderia sp. ZP32-5]|uniref:type II secretion system protein GspL n=1 Tax=Paraburkholderia sp. ZP32-5 TaxID=2883245 RepID=UPI001F41BBEB|nr:type II secretion system protein GspL [Paraburkholderia sp. ZP32-5]
MRQEGQKAAVTSLTVLLPSIEQFDPHAWMTMPLRYGAADRNGGIETGEAPLEHLPRAAKLVLVLSARDTLLLEVSLPPVDGVKLRRLLPHAVEEFLIDDPQRGHIAVGPASAQEGRRAVAVIDRARFAALLDWFAEAGYRRVRAVPLILCVPLDDEAGDKASAADDRTEPALKTDEPNANTPLAEETAVTVEDTSLPAAAQPRITSVLVLPHRGLDNAKASVGLRFDEHATAEPDPTYELAVRQHATGFAIVTPRRLVEATLAELARREPLRISVLAQPARDAVPAGARPMSWTELAAHANACPLDLCQFEFANRSRAQSGAGGLRAWRWAIGLAAAAVAVSIGVVNVQWFQLRHREAALNAQWEGIVKAALPGTAVILDPRSQMQSGLARLRGAAGELRPDDYLVLAAGLSRALAPVPSDAIAVLDYSDGALDVSFKPGTTMDGGALRHRLQALGLTVHEDNGKWTIGSAPPGSH